MSIPNTISHVNNKLKKGYSIAKIERELNLGKDTLRKKLNRANYKYNKILNQFIFEDSNSATQGIAHTSKNAIESIKRHTEIKVITTNITPKTTQNKISKYNDSAHNKYQKNNDAEKQQRAFTDEEFNLLFEIIRNYKLKKNNTNIPREDSDVITRSFRSYKSILDMFANYCKDNELNQKDAIADALILYMSK
ncbi:DUF4250 domain-containing protein [Clostridium beijerinckii]|uniref:DUF4250 domain-containing protein n=1 Tax=Clostridium beijerinckii TaxID=1520 RepID=UPI001360E896|nr:DUF4250 domain-containing protein [Clostridium beijerinckii]MZK53608.1 hypothetical protein [Clostridium beijerinckii]MZK61713.1 hypothetical protein [Clostridium beijerinckii]MZK71473.1 hypothetical protein [Clostridium beijerinckii]MZK76832.1 hypothetical protein [Clostridium beijerinckii]MZK85542.1 hypothetical protein [Clostridium beijerinckii]